MTGFGNKVITVTVPAEALSVLCRAVYDPARRVYACPFCDAVGESREGFDCEFIIHAAACPVPEVWAWAEATSSLAKTPSKAVTARVERALTPPREIAV